MWVATQIVMHAPYSKACTSSFSTPNGLHDSLIVPFKIHGPLIESTCCYGDKMPHFGGRIQICIAERVLLYGIYC